MKKIQIIISLFVLSILTACTEDSRDVNLDSVSAPSNISALVTITQDNSGNVTFMPRGESAARYEIYFADGTLTPAVVMPGENATHKYNEGVYNVKIIGSSLNGTSTEVIQKVTVSFLQPTNLIAKIAPVSGDNYSISVTATANLEAFFQVYFGDVANEVPVNFMEGETITHKYVKLGSYTVRVVALSGGAATKEYTQTVVISDPIVLPLTFETISPAFVNFGGANSVVVVNPSIGGINSSAKVGKLTKDVGSEVWAGSLIELAGPIDFTNKIFRMKVWSPKAGIVVKFKVENLTDANINKEVDATTTVANAWEELSFDFSSIDLSGGKTYQKVVVFFDFGNSGTGASYYFDDIKLVPPPLSLDFETPTPFSGDFGGASTVTVANPHINSNNPSAKVGANTKAAAPGGEVWGGSFITLAKPMDFSSQKKFKMKVWSTKAGTPMLFKVENLTDPAISKEVIVPTTVVGGWETLTFDFSTLDLSGGKTYQKVVLIFDIGTAGSPTTFYFDDIKQSF